MAHRYKSSPSKVFKSFLKSILVICFTSTALAVLALLLTGVLDNNTHAENRRLFLAMLLATGSFSVILGAYFAFRRYNIRVEVRHDAIAFFRGSKEYLHFGYGEYAFTTLVVKQSFSLVPMSTTRALRVIPKNGGKVKNHTCHCFAKNVFEEMIASLKQAGYEWEIANEGKRDPGETLPPTTGAEPAPGSDGAAGSNEAAEHGEASLPDLLPLEFRIDKKAWIKRYPLVLMSVLYGVLLLIIFVGAVAPAIMGGNSTNVAFAGGLFLLLLLLFGGLHYALCIAPVNRIKKSAPEKIVLETDKIVIDGKAYSFSGIERITATPYSYSVASATFQRKLSIAEGGKAHDFPICPSDAIRKKSPPVFENYELFYKALQSILLEKSAREKAPCKFAADLR